ncbi:MAG: hypothetical protein NVSMB29_10900 [Candidatus Dormibacteria bacterium]
MKRRSALSKVSPSRTFTSDTVGITSFAPREAAIVVLPDRRTRQTRAPRIVTDAPAPPTPRDQAGAGDRQLTPRGSVIQLVPSVSLDPAQQAAVDHRQGPCLVVAGPGSGKTRVIVERFLALVDAGIPAEHQLVLTYTIKAAAEMRERAEAVHGPFSGPVPLLNFHSFARRVLRDWGWLIGVAPSFRMVDAAERWLHCEAVLAQLRPRTLWNPLRPHDLVDPLLRVIEAAKQELVTPDAYAAWAQDRLHTCGDEADRALLERHQESAAVYAALDDRYRHHAVLDHDDCILLAESLLRDQPAVRRAVADRITQVMVDEYQDTNYAQARLVETLVAGHRNLFVVADDDQSIYKFRGASRANLERFERVYAGHPTIVLTENYRSTPEIVSAARCIIETAPVESRIDKRLHAVRPPGAPVELWQAPDERSEARALSAECAALVAAGTPPHGIAWLFRRHADMAPVMAALRDAGVPYVVHGGRGYFQQPEVKDLLALLGAAADPEDTQAVLRCLHLPSWQVSAAGRRTLVAAADQHDRPLAHLLTTPGLGLSDDDATAVARCVGAITALHAQSARDDVRELFEQALELSDYLGLLDAATPLARAQMGANLNKFGELLEGFADWSDDRRLSTALRYLAVLRDSGSADEIAAVDWVEDGVALLTAHSAKGLEWPVVVINGCIEGRWPGRSGFAAQLRLPDELVPEPPPQGDALADEERRLFYVAATRARDRLLLSRAKRYRRSYADERLTPFLRHLDSAPATSHREAGRAAPVTSSRRAPAPPAEGRLRLSVSELIAFRACPRRFEYRRRYRMPVHASTRSWFGIMAHGVLQAAAMMRRSGEPVDAEVVAALWGQAWAQGRGPRGTHPELRAYGENQLRRYVESPLWTDATIDCVEEEFSVPLTVADLRGRFDRIDLPAGSPPTVVDYKTGPPRASDSAARDLQVRAYAVAVHQRTAAQPVAVELHQLQTAERVRVDFDQKSLGKVHYQLDATATELAGAWRDGAFPAQPSTYNCRRCDYRTVCDEGRNAAD